MKRRGYWLVLISAILLALVGCSGGDTDRVAGTDWEKADLRGRVHRVVVRSTGVSDQGMEKETVYNDRGFLERDVYRDMSGEGMPDNSTTYLYDGQGRLVEVRYAEDGNPAERAEYKYNEFGQLLSTMMYNTDGDLREMTSYTYDAQGRAVMEEYTNPVEMMQIENIYDALGNKVGVRYMDNAGTLVRREEHDYDASGRRVSERLYNADGGLISRSVYAYDGKGRVVLEEEYDSEGVLESREVLAYDEYDNLVSGEISNLDGVVMRYAKRYEYDGVGNWTRSVGLRQDGDGAQLDTTYVDERTIEYYK